MTWVEVTMNDDVRRWDYAFGPPSTLPTTGDRVESCPTLVLTWGDMERMALLSEEVARHDVRVKSVAAHMARWDDASSDVPAVRLYVWGSIGFTDGSTRQGLCLLVVDLAGTVQAMIPLPELEIS